MFWDRHRHTCGLSLGFTLTFYCMYDTGAGAPEEAQDEGRVEGGGAAPTEAVRHRAWNNHQGNGY